MKLSLKLLIIMAILNLTYPMRGSLPNNNAGFNFEPIKVELYSLLLYTQNIATLIPQLVTIIPEIKFIASNANSLQQNLFTQKEVASYTSLVMGLVLYFYYNDNLDLSLIESDLSAMLSYTQSIAAIVPQISDTIAQMELINPNVNTVNTPEEQLVYSAMILGYLNYFAYLQSPF